MESTSSIIAELSKAWPMIQPYISTVVSAVVASLFLRKNTSKTEIEKIKQAKFSELADKLLDGGHITHLEYYKCRNFINIAKKADKVFTNNKYNDHNNKTDNKNEKLNIDWFVRFFEDAGNISDDDMQDLWARILAGEIFRPGHYSLRTLETLRNMSCKEAESLQRVAPLVIHDYGNAFIYGSNSITISHTYTGEDILRLSDCGIVDDFEDRSYKKVVIGSKISENYMGIVDKEDILFLLGHICCVAHNENIKSLKIPACRFTTVGAELLSVVTIDTTYSYHEHEQYAIECFKLLRKSFPDINISIHKCNFNHDYPDKLGIMRKIV